MYGKRLKILLALCSIVAVFCVFRLVQMQLFAQSWYRSRIADLQQNTVNKLTTRGRILDRAGRVLASDELSFDLCMTYRLTSAIDERAIGPGVKAHKEAQENMAHLDTALEKCARLFSADTAAIMDRIRYRNDRIWSIRLFQAWRDACPDSPLLRTTEADSVGLSEALADFEQRVPDPSRRADLARKVNIAEMRENWPLLPLKTADDLLAAQLEFMDTPGIDVAPRVNRVYPFKDSGAQIIGWVGPVNEHYQLPLADDESRSYTAGELCGRSGVEYVCEAVLRGRRGQRTYDFDRNILNEVDRFPGSDVTLTLDMNLQKSIEQVVKDPSHNPMWQNPISVVIIDVATSEVLTLASLPTYDLSTIRQKYSEVVKEPNSPLLSRALEGLYAPGSVIKPVILIAGLESKAITRTEVISCPSHAAPLGWPNCSIWRSSHVGHDTLWPNYSVNAIKGSCNVYFSHLADRLDAAVLQRWLLAFGYGDKALARQNLAEEWAAAASIPKLPPRFMPEQAGIVHSGDPAASKASGALPPIADFEKKMFGIGQGSLRVTPIEVANAMAAIARRGVYKSPRLFISGSHTSGPTTEIGISSETMDTLREGMYAVVNAEGGTAYKAFRSQSFWAQGIKVFGKTGSTQAPEHAWFGGFVEDNLGRSLAIAIIIEGGKSGGADAAPLARDILTLCVNAGHIGPRTIAPADSN
jgi:penicillin-binding protein 2